MKELVEFGGAAGEDEGFGEGGRIAGGVLWGKDEFAGERAEEDVERELRAVALGGRREAEAAG